MVLAVIVALLAGWLLITIAVEEPATDSTKDDSMMMEEGGPVPSDEINPESVEISVEVYDPNAELSLTVTE